MTLPLTDCIGSRPFVARMARWYAFAGAERYGILALRSRAPFAIAFFAASPR